MDHLIPDQTTLVKGLATVLLGPGKGVRIVARRPNTQTSRCLSEIVVCRLEDGRQLQLLCKYQNGNGYCRADIEYEAKVYSQLLDVPRSGTPKFYGTYRESTSGQTWLILEYLDQSMSLDELADPQAAVRAAAWLGRFHATWEARLACETIPFLKVYDLGYYTSYARRVLELAGKEILRFPWIADLCFEFERLAAALFASPRTLTHGDYHLWNVLFQDGDLYCIDWEMAGISAGEVDLACLVEGWPEIAPQCELEYRQARWPDGSPADFGQRLDSARLALNLYRLGERPGWPNHADAASDLEALRLLASRLGARGTDRG